MNSISYVEIPVTDLDRAVDFYAVLLGHAFERDEIDGYRMALFPFEPGETGASGALVQGDVYRPGRDGAVVYHHVDDIDRVLALAATLGAEILYPAKDLGPLGQVAEIQDSEGNRLALHQPAASAVDTA